MNHRDFNEPPPSSFRFLVAGHIYGRHGGDAPHPAVTFTNNMHVFLSLDLSMMVLLGDTVWAGTRENFDGLEQDVLNRFDFPVFNAVGNHDIGDRDLYERLYGPTFYTFQYGPAQMVFLDTELDDCVIAGEQRQMLASSLMLASQDETIHHIFVFIHKPMFLESKAILRSTNSLARPNDPRACTGSNYPQLRSEMIMPAAQIKPVYLIAGDVGAWGGNLSPFFQKDPDSNLFTITTGIGDTPEDAVLLVSISGAAVDFEMLSLTEQPTEDIEAYDQDYWEAVARSGHLGPGTRRLYVAVLGISLGLLLALVVRRLLPGLAATR